MVAAVAIILLHTFVPHHHHTTHGEASALTCCDRDCHDHESDGEPIEGCRLQQLLAMLTLSTQEHKFVATDMLVYLDLAPWMAATPQIILSYTLIERHAASVPLPDEPLSAGLGLRGPPLA